jgi:HKD family nuclease
LREDILTALGKEKNVSNVIVLTHNIDFIFIQTVLLKHLKKCGNPTLTIFADAQCVSETYENQKSVISGIGKRYRVVPVYLDRPYDRFHPKAVLLSGIDKATLYVGSGNLTFGGWRQNAEIWNSFDSLADGTGVFNAFQDYLYGCLKRLPFTKNIDRSIHEAYDTSTKNWAKIPGDPHGLISRINSNQSLLDQMKEHAPAGCELLIIQSPYFDNEGKTIAQLDEAFKPKLIEVFAQNRYSEITQRIIDALPNNASIVTTDFNHISEDKTRRAFLHAKFYAFIYADRVIVFSGSANCSQAALALNIATLGNAELMSVHTMSPSDFSAQYLNEIVRVSEPYTPLEMDDVEDNILDEGEGLIQIQAVQYEYNQIVVAYKPSLVYEIIGCKVDNKEHSVTWINTSLLVIDNINSEPLRICLLLRHKLTNQTISSNDMWIDYERDLSTSAKTRYLGDFIQSSNDLSWNHNTWGELIKVFNEHLSYTPKKTDSFALDSSVDKHETMSVFNANDVFVNSYSFKPVLHIWSGKNAFDINTVLRQYLGLNNLHHGDEGSPTPLTQEEIEALALKGELTVDKKIYNKPDHPTEIVDEKSRKKIQKLIESLTAAFTKPEIIENRPLPLLLTDLKVASIILRMGLHKQWITDEEYFDTTYTLWTELFFSCKKYPDIGYIGYKLRNEHVESETLRSPELSATMLAWLFAVEPSRDLKYTRLIFSAILVHAKYNWVFWGGDQEEINEELNRTLFAILDDESVKKSLQGHGDLWDIISKTGTAFSELIAKLHNFKVSDFKDTIKSGNVLKGDLLWQGNENFYIVKSNFSRTEKPEIKTDVFSINSNKEDKSFVPSFTIPVTGLLSSADKLISNHSKEIIVNFINSHLLDPSSTLRFEMGTNDSA